MKRDEIQRLPRKAAGICLRKFRVRERRRNRPRRLLAEDREDRAASLDTLGKIRNAQKRPFLKTILRASVTLCDLIINYSPLTKSRRKSGRRSRNATRDARLRLNKIHCPEAAPIGFRPTVKVRPPASGFTYSARNPGTRRRAPFNRGLPSRARARALAAS